jgi:hypothetical protein
MNAQDLSEFSFNKTVYKQHYYCHFTVHSFSLSTYENPIKFTLEQAKKAPRWSKVQLYSFFNLGATWGVGVQCLATANLPPGMTQYPLYRRLGGPQGRSGRVRKISPPPPPGFDPQTVQSMRTP